MEQVTRMNFLSSHQTRQKPVCRACTKPHIMTISSTSETISTTTTTTNSHHRISNYYSKHKRRRPMYSSLMITLIIIITLIHRCITDALAYNDQQCQPTGSFFCNIDNYNTVHPFNNTLGHTTLEDAHSSLHRYAFLLEIDHCRDRVPLFLCSLYFPVCVSSPDAPINLLLPCRDICEEARKCEPYIRQANMSWPEEWDCDKFKSYTKEFKMCVINNQKEGNSTQQMVSGKASMPKYSLPPSPISIINPPPVLQPLLDQQEVCEQGLFDCRSSDPKRPFCIDKKYVCDGKIDCYNNETLRGPDMGLDEMNCKQGCEEGQVHCDAKCISPFEICDGKPDCNSGIDELNCFDYTTDWIQYFIPITCLIVITSAIWCMLKRFLDSESTDDDKGQPCESIPSETHENISTHSLPSLIDHTGTVIYQKPYQPTVLHSPPPPPPPPPLPPQLASQQPLIQSPAHLDELLNCREPMYQEPSILARSDAYYRTIPGGYSGASSDYGTYFDDLKDMSSAASVNYMVLPPAPPPTPALNYYENIID